MLCGWAVGANQEFWVGAQPPYPSTSLPNIHLVVMLGHKEGTKSLKTQKVYKRI